MNFPENIREDIREDNHLFLRALQMNYMLFGLFALGCMCQVQLVMSDVDSIMHYCPRVLCSY